MEISKENQQLTKINSKELTDVVIRLSIVGVVVFVSFKIFNPFLGIMLWALVLAVTLYPMHQKLAGKLSASQGKSSTIIVLIGALLIGVPIAMMGNSVSTYAQKTQVSLKNDTFTISKPPESVTTWPIVGKKIYSAWDQASENLPKFINNHKSSVTEFFKSALSFATGFISGTFSFFFSLIIAGIMMAWGKEGSASLLKISCRIAGYENGTSLHKLSTATIRSVSMGVIGVAFVQAILFGIGLVVADIPGSGLIAIVVLLLGIAQIPAPVVGIPVIVYIWYTGDSTVMNMSFTVYFLLAGLSDNVLKPLLLGRGVDAPMPVVLLGALGGAISAGLLGLFIGAVFLSLAYVIFMNWVDTGMKANQHKDNSQDTGQSTNK